MKKILSISVIFILISCSYKPILDDNYKYLNTPQEKTEKTIENCEKRAKNHLKGIKARRAGKEAVRKGAIGTFFGSIFGFLIGGNVSSLARGAAVGGGVGAATGAASVAGEGKVKPDQIKRRYVTNCLAREGYSVIGWE